MTKLPENVQAYSRSPTFDESSIPAALRKDHQTKAGVWGVINILSGQLLYTAAASGTESTLSPEVSGVIKPESPHSVKPIGPVTFYVEFWR